MRDRKVKHGVGCRADKQYVECFLNVCLKTGSFISVMREDNICQKFYSARNRLSDKFLTCLIKYFIMENVEESIWGTASQNSIMMTKENWEWKQNDLWE